ncbi:MAG: caspase family protein [Thiotrichaceae bacterium]|nr:caspase family protein [Thiotrichaceae bacterium]
MNKSDFLTNCSSPAACYRIAILLMSALMLGCAAVPEHSPIAPEVRQGAADKLLPVDCLLPAELRQLGSGMSYFSPRRAIKATAVECEIRGGEYVAYNRADYRTALIVWLDKAKKGDAEAQTYVGEIYEKGLGLEPNFRLAQIWYRKAAEQGFYRAQINLGYLYEKGLGVKKDTVVALNWYRKASGIEDDGLDYTSVIEVKAATLAQEKSASLRQDVNRREREIKSLDDSLKSAKQSLTEQVEVLARTEQTLAALTVEMASAAGSEKASEMELEFAVQQKKLAEVNQLYRALKSQVEREQRIVNSQVQKADIQKQALLTQAQPLAGPSIEVFDPSIVVTRSGEPRVLVRAASKARVISGRVMAPAGLKLATLNERPLSIDSTGQFHSAVPVTNETQHVMIHVTDRLDQKAAFSFMLVPDKQISSFKEDASRFSRVAGSIDFGRYFALVIGNNEYVNFPKLKTAVSDARRVAELLEDKFGFDVRLITNADRYTILSALNEIKGKMSEADNLLVYYAGHGERDVQSLQGYWLPVDAELENTANWIPNAAISSLFNTMSARHILVVADSCYSGSMTSSSVARLNADLDDQHLKKWLKVMAKTNSRTVLTSGGMKPVLDSGGGDYSVFAKEFIAELENATGAIDAYKIYLNIFPRVKINAALHDFDQTPTYAPIKYAGHGGGEFIFVKD